MSSKFETLVADCPTHFNPNPMPNFNKNHTFELKIQFAQKINRNERIEGCKITRGAWIRIPLCPLGEASEAINPPPESEREAKKVEPFFSFSSLSLSRNKLTHPKSVSSSSLSLSADAYSWTHFHQLPSHSLSLPSLKLLVFCAISGKSPFFLSLEKKNPINL